jgi:hypothetical protein
VTLFRPVFLLLGSARARKPDQPWNQKLRFRFEQIEAINHPRTVRQAVRGDSYARAIVVVATFAAIFGNESWGGKGRQHGWPDETTPG